MRRLKGTYQDGYGYNYLYAQTYQRQGNLTV